MKRDELRPEDPDTMRPEYNSSGAVRGATVARYREGTNVMVISPDVLDVFPDAEAVNEALRALAVLIRQRREADASLSQT